MGRMNRQTNNASSQAFKSQVKFRWSFTRHKPWSPKWHSKIKTILLIELTTLPEIVPLYTIPLDFPRVFCQKIPHIIMQIVLQGRIWQSMYTDVRPNVHVMWKWCGLRLSWSSLKHALLCPAKPHPSGWNSKCKLVPFTAIWMWKSSMASRCHCS